MKTPRFWRYTPTIPGGDARKLVTLQEESMVWVGIRAWNAQQQCWFNGAKRETATVLAWVDLPFPANDAGGDPGIFWENDMHARVECIDL